MFFGRRAACLLLSLVLLPAAAAAAETLALRATVTPELPRGIAMISAVARAFYDEAPVRNGVFAFKKLEPGTYTLTVLDPQWGVTSRTVQVTRNFADGAGRVDIQVVLERSEDARRRNLERENSVSLGDLTVSPKARAAFKAARRRLTKGDREGSIARLLQAVELSPGFVEAWNELGTLAYKADDYEQAEEYFRAALRHDPEAFAPMVNLGGALLSQQRIDDALPYNLMAQSMRPDDALANAQLGMNFFYKQQFDKARNHLLRAKEADRGHFSHPQFFLAEIYVRAGKPQAARRELEELMRLHAGAPAAELARQALARVKDQAPPTPAAQPPEGPP